MPDPATILTSMAVAAIIAAVAVAGLSLVSTSWGASLAVAVGLGVGVYFLGLRPHFPPTEAADRLLFVLLPAVVVAELVALVGKKVATVARSVVAFSAMPVIVFGSTYVTDVGGPGTRQWSTAVTAGIYAGAGAAITSVVWLTVRLAQRTKSPTSLVALAITSVGAAVAVMLSGSARDGQLGLALGAAAMGVAAACWLLRAKIDPSGAVGVTTVVQAAVLLLGWLFADLSPWHAVAIALAPLLAWIPELCLPRGRPRIRAGLRLALPAGVVFAVVMLAQRQFIADGGPAATGGATLSDYLGFEK